MGEDGRSRGIYYSRGEVEKVYFLAVNMDANLVTWAFSEVFAWAFSGALSWTLVDTLSVTLTGDLDFSDVFIFLDCWGELSESVERLWAFLTL